jgi:hypothetical protein
MNQPTKKQESDFVEFLTYKTDQMGDVVAVMLNKWKNKEFVVTRKRLEQRLIMLSSEGERPDISAKVLENWPVDADDDSKSPIASLQPD